MLIAHLENRLRERAAQSLTRRRRTVEGPCAPHQRVSPPGGGDARAMLAFCSNDYLGLAGDARLAEALAEGARLHGVGSGASHLISGHHRAHEALDDALAAMLAPNVPDARALSFSTGYMANLALLTALGDAQATLFSDKLNHASIIDGARLAAAAVQRYPHGQVERLDAWLAACVTPIKLIVTDAVFSMDGDLAPLPELLALAERHDAWIVLDDAHGFGVLGPRGAGTLAHFGLRSERFIVMGTLGKAAGLAGAFVAAHPVVIDALVQTARSYIYTTAASPAMAHALRASLAIIEGDEGASRRAHLQALIARLREGLTALIADHAGLGWSLPPSPTAIQPLIVGSNDAALALAAGLEAQGLWVPAIRPPTVPVGSARLRLTLSAAHTMGDVERLLEVLRALAAAASGAASRAACEQAAATAGGTPGATTSTTGGTTDGVTA